MAGAPQIFDSSLIAARRNRFAADAETSDFLLHRAADDLAERLAIVKRHFARAANVGAYHGIVSEALRRLANVEQIVDVEPASALLQRGKGPKLQADLETLPFAAESLDLIVSALSWQYVNDVPGLLVQARQALKPDGLMLAALLGGETLKELRDAWLIAESEMMGGVSPRVAPFADVRDLGALLQRAGFALPVADNDVFTVTYEDPFALMRELQRMAASNPLHERSRIPVTRRLLFRAAEIYRQRYAEPSGRIRATFEIITLTAWAPHASQQQPLKPGSARMRLAEALRVEERSAGEKPPPRGNK